MRKYQLFIVGIVILLCLTAVFYLVNIIEKIENESVSTKGINGIILYTTNKANSTDTEDILKGIDKNISEHIKTKVLGTLNSSKNVEEAIQDDIDNAINYSVIEFNRSGFIREKNLVTLKIPSKDSINYKESLNKAEKIKSKAEGLNIKIIESRNTPKLLNTYICIEVTDSEAPSYSKALLDKLILLGE